MPDDRLIVAIAIDERIAFSIAGYDVEGVNEPIRSYALDLEPGRQPSMRDLVRDRVAVLAPGERRRDRHDAEDKRQNEILHDSPIPGTQTDIRPRRPRTRYRIDTSLTCHPGSSA
jgi:hypothetical protein